ncbi:MAG TPA: hypothetical protein VK802_09725 [Streptosporangiaceae bacterium]|nr:hypothetical protein [Streptosporangiaceae bacterium]
MTTSQAYQADGDQQVPEDEHALPEDNLTELGSDVAGPDPDPMAPDADQAGSEDPASPPFIAMAPAGPESETSTASDYPGSAAGGDDAQERGMPDTSPAGPSLISAAFTVPGSATDSRPAGNHATADGPWNEIQAMFVDDPRASIESAAGLVDGRVEELIQSLTERQHSIQSGWQADDAGTEELRVALRHYRTFWNSLDDLPAPA